MLWLHIETKYITEANKLNIVHEGNKFLDNLPFYDGIQLCPEILINGMYERWRVLSTDKWYLEWVSSVERKIFKA